MARKNKSRKQKSQSQPIQASNQYSMHDSMTASRRKVSAARGYDASQVTRNNERHWENAAGQGMTSDQINSPSTRAILKSHSRYECSNAGYLKRAVKKIPIDVVGTRININIKSSNESFNSECEKALKDWKKVIKLESTLRTLYAAKMIDGEALALPVNKPRVGRKTKTGISLDLMKLSCDRLTSKSNVNTVNNIDGVHLDSFMDPDKYEIAESTDVNSYIGNFETTEFEAENVYHWFEKTDPEAHRGIPELTSTLELNGKKRNYTDSVVSAARNAADLSAVIEQEVQGFDGSATPGEAFEIERNSIMTLGPNQKLKQIQAGQPVDAFKEFKGELDNEGMSPTGLPNNVVKSNSESMNFSSARFDYFIMWGKDRDVFRSEMEEEILEDFIMRGVEEFAALTRRMVPSDIVLDFSYDVDKYINPVQEVKAKVLETSKNDDGIAISSMKSLYTPQGKDWKEEFDQQVEEALYMHTARKNAGLITDDTQTNEGGNG